MTVGELIAELQRFDPTQIVCINDTEMTPAADEVDECAIGDDRYVVIYASSWPEGECE